MTTLLSCYFVLDSHYWRGDRLDAFPIFFAEEKRGGCHRSSAVQLQAKQQSAVVVPHWTLQAAVEIVSFARPLLP